MPKNNHRVARATRPTRLARRRPGRRLAARLLSVAATAGLATGALATAAAAPASAAQARVNADAGMPRYYVLGQETATGAGVVQVRSSATGAVISSVTGPAACDPKTFKFATADDRNFVVGCDTPQATSQSIGFYRLQVSSRGRPSGLRPLAIKTPDDALDAVDLTPDGGRLAIAMQGYNEGPGGPGAVEVVTLKTGATRTWTGSSPYDLTWTDNGRELGLFEGSGLYRFNPGTTGTTLKSARQVLSRSYHSSGVETAKLSPDGRTIIASVTYDLGNKPLHRGVVVGGIVRISAQTKQQLATLLPIHAQYSADGGGSEAGWYQTNCVLGPIDRTGRHMLVNCDRVGRLDRSRFTALPGVPSVASFSAAW